MRGTWRRGASVLVGGTEGYVKEGSEMGIFVHKDSTGEPWRGRSCTGNFKRKVRDMQRSPWK